MTLEDIKNRINEMCTLFAFEYCGKDGNIDPYRTKDGKDRFLLFFDGYEKTVSSIDAAINDPFIDGKSLSDVYSEITITEW